MASFDLAIPIVLQHEGVHSNLRGDPGGETYFGFSTPFLRQHGLEPPKSEDEAVALYRQYFWLPIYQEITAQNISTKVFDDHVNQGMKPAHENLQRALVSLGHSVAVDGVLGDETLEAINVSDQETLLKSMAEEQRASYSEWIKQNPSQRMNLKRGLYNRAAWPWTPLGLGWNT